jgi:BirA family transcriptional regulator, biotin operon repressor / biotin---[acetyl-CoA-carboxylase] ligase
MNLLRNVNVIDGSVVYTDNQTQGKGQRGALWHSSNAQNITASVILKPQFLSISQTFYLSKISALAVYDVLTDIVGNSQYDIKIKWPNDIIVNHSKIAGILIENVFAGNHIQHCVIGIGLNVNQVDFVEFERKATSLKNISNNTFDKEDVLKLLCAHLEKWYFKLKESKFDFINASYKSNLYGINSVMRFSDINNVVFEGEILDVTTSGKLLLKLDNLNEREFEVKELKFIV